MATTQLLRLPAVCTLVGLSRSEIYRRMERGDFPPSIALGVRARAWSSEAINEWIRERLATGEDRKQRRQAPKRAR